MKIALAINFALFVVESIFGNRARSPSLVADSLEMLGDSFVYAASLYVIGKKVRWNAGIWIRKSVIMGGFGIWIIAQAILRFLQPSLPVAETLGWIAGLALLGNLVCAGMLLRFRDGDINMRSTWTCSRNDVIANLGVLLAAAFVSCTQSAYPDLIVGIIIAALVLSSAYSVLRRGIDSLKSQIQVS